MDFREKSFLLIFFTNCILILFLSCKGISQFEQVYPKTNHTSYIPYYLKVYEADSLFIIKDYESAFKILDSLYEVYEPLNMEVYREYNTYIAAAVATNNTKNLKKITKKSFLLYGSTIDEFRLDSLLKKALKITKIKEKDIADYRNLYVDNLNLELRSRVEKMIEEDQELRKKEPINNEELKRLTSKHEADIVHIFKRYGYPNNKLIGYYNLNETDVDIKIIFLHSSTHFKENILIPALLNFVKKGECLPSVYATVYDRNMINNKEVQYYGTYNKKNGTLMQLSNTKNQLKLDSIRKSVGLPHINYNKWRLKAKYNVEFNFNF